MDCITQFQPLLLTDLIRVGGNRKVNNTSLTDSAFSPEFLNRECKLTLTKRRLKAKK